MSKFIHISDLHIGKTHEAADLENDQREVLAEILGIVRSEVPDGVLIAGDVYDRSMPAEYAVRMLSDFLQDLCSVCPVYMISGNHDSGGRLNFVAGILAQKGLYIAGDYAGSLKPIRNGDTDIYLMPYLHPSAVRHVLENDVSNMDEAVRAVLETCEPGTGKYKVLVAHLFATDSGKLPETCESEQKYVGGIDSVDVSAFEGFDYVALGHIHGPQAVGRETIRYSGTPMMYSFSEQYHVKSLCVVEPGSEEPVRLIPLTAGRRMRTVKGTLSELLQPDFDPLDHNDIVLAELTDPTAQVNAASRLADLYKTVMIKYSALGETEAGEYDPVSVKLDDPLELFEHFFEERNNGKQMTPEMREEIARLLKNAKED